MFGSDISPKINELLKNVPQADVDSVVNQIKANPDIMKKIQADFTPEQALNLLNQLTPEDVQQAFQDIKITG